MANCFDSVALACAIHRQGRSAVGTFEKGNPLCTGSNSDSVRVWRRVRVS